MFRPLLLLAWIIITSAHPAHAQETNAALLYYEAAQQFRGFTQEESTLIRITIGNAGLAATTPFPEDEARLLVGRHAEAIATFHRATLLPDCDWRPLWEKGVSSSFNLQRELIALLQLTLVQARLHLTEQHSLKALEHYRSALAFADQSTSPLPRGTGVTSQNVARNRIIRGITADLMRLDDPGLRALSEMLNLPPSYETLHMMMETESKDREVRVQVVKTQIAAKISLSDGYLQAITLWFTTFGERKKAREHIREIRREAEALRPLKAALALPPAAAYERLLELRTGLPFQPDGSIGFNPSRPDTLLLLTALTALRTDVYFAMIRAAIAIRLEGKKALEKQRDPTTGKPFRYEKTSSGFRLISDFPGAPPLTFEP